jgi:ribosomal protein S12 methylthiotransferase accessory factor YcaO
VKIDPVLWQEQLKYAAAISHALTEVLSERQLVQRVPNDRTLCARDRQGVWLDFHASQRVGRVGRALAEYQDPQTFAREQRRA